jgi:hypothetical protein
MSESTIVERMFRAKYGLRVRLEEAIAPLASSLLGYDQSAAEAFAKSRERRIWNQVIKIVDEENRKGLYPTFEILDPSRFELSWFAAGKATDSKRVRLMKMRLAHRGEILDVIDGVAAREYEALGCVICRFAGASKWYLTPANSDWGIDFLALVPAFGRSHIFPLRGRQIRVVGQSKKWADPVPREKLELLVNKAEDIRRRNSELLSILPDWFISADGPIVGCMLSHRGAQSGAWDYAQSHGVVIANSRDLAEIVSLSRAWDLQTDVQGVTDCIRSNILEILQA